MRIQELTFRDFKFSTFIDNKSFFHHLLTFHEASHSLNPRTSTFYCLLIWSYRQFAGYLDENDNTLFFHDSANIKVQERGKTFIVIVSQFPSTVSRNNASSTGYRFAFHVEKEIPKAIFIIPKACLQNVLNIINGGTEEFAVKIFSFWILNKIFIYLDDMCEMHPFRNKNATLYKYFPMQFLCTRYILSASTMEKWICRKIWQTQIHRNRSIYERKKKYARIDIFFLYITNVE